MRERRCYFFARASIRTQQGTRSDNWTRASMNAVGGSVAHGFEAVRDAFAQAQSNNEGGAQLCVYREGLRVVDIWAGSDKIRGRPYGENTIAMMMSCTK